MGAKIAIAATCALVLAVGIVRKPTLDQRLVGRWELDAASALAGTPDDENHTTETAALRAILAEARIEMEFTLDQMRLSTKLPGREEERQGRYRIARVDGNKVFVEWERDGQWEPETVELYGSTLWFETAGMRLALRRVE
ncbi:MAG: hypothetical protein HC813_01535 [Planctomycetes bacterium]|nr:hypothetical protein [Planctomycetota bacterium]